MPSPSHDSIRRPVPPWALVTITILSLVLLGYFVWRTLAGPSPDVGPPKKVHPGMYDLRAEAAKQNAAPEAGGVQHGP